MPSVLIFSGHRIDAPDRLKARFPARVENAVSKAIGKAINELSPSYAIASASNGGDILFLEACRARKYADDDLPTVPG